MANHYVKCKYCGETFNRDKIEFIKIGNRYAHKECVEKHEANKTQEEKDIENLENYIKEKFNEPYINVKIKRQIEEYHKQYQYSYSGMLKTLIYWFEVKGNSIDKANGGIGIIPYIFNEARDYYYKLYLAQLKNLKIDQNFKIETKIISIPPPAIERKKSPKLFFEGDN